ncbi:hypothetical protein P7C70_g4059, partial [Phenoliferia sp. Uapishka_3]
MTLFKHRPSFDSTVDLLYHGEGEDPEDGSDTEEGENLRDSTSMMRPSMDTTSSFLHADDDATTSSFIHGRGRSSSDAPSTRSGLYPTTSILATAIDLPERPPSPPTSQFLSPLQPTASTSTSRFFHRPTQSASAAASSTSINTLGGDSLLPPGRARASTLRSIFTRNGSSTFLPRNGSSTFLPRNSSSSFLPSALGGDPIGPGAGRSPYGQGFAATRSTTLSEASGSSFASLSYSQLPPDLFSPPLPSLHSYGPGTEPPSFQDENMLRPSISRGRERGSSVSTTASPLGPRSVRSPPSSPSARLSSESNRPQSPPSLEQQQQTTLSPTVIPLPPSPPSAPYKFSMVHSMPTRDFGATSSNLVSEPPTVASTEPTPSTSASAAASPETSNQFLPLPLDSPPINPETAVAPVINLTRASIQVPDEQSIGLAELAAQEEYFDSLFSQSSRRDASTVSTASFATAASSATIGPSQ